MQYTFLCSFFLNSFKDNVSLADKYEQPSDYHFLQKYIFQKVFSHFVCQKLHFKLVTLGKQLKKSKTAPALKCFVLYVKKKCLCVLCLQG